MIAKIFFGSGKIPIRELSKNINLPIKKARTRRAKINNFF